MSTEIPPRVIVTSSTTAVDTDALVGDHIRLERDAGLLAAAESHLETARRALDQWWTSAPESTARLAAAVDEALVHIRRALATTADLADDVGYAAVVYASAEADAAGFERVWRAVCPESPNVWSTGFGTSHESLRIQKTLDVLPAWIVDILVHPRLSTMSGYTALAMDGAQFASGGGDPYGGLRTQYDVDAMAQRIVNGTWVVFGPDDLDTGDTTGAAGLAASWLFGVGALKHGHSSGVVVAEGVRTGSRRIAVADSESRPAYGAVTILPGDPGLVFGIATLGLIGSTVPAAGPGRAEEATRAAIEALPEGTAPQRSPTPMTPSTLLGEISTIDGGGESGQIKILEHQTMTASGMTTSWSVVIRGTQDWGEGGSNPQDLLTNLQAVSADASDQTTAVLTAMEMAGIGADEPVEFVGHSQGGIVAAQLAADPEVGARYDVRSVLTAGSPTGGFQPVEGARMLALENTRDIVPALDGTANKRVEGVTTVSFDGAMIDVEESGPVPSAHSLDTYRGLMSRIESTASGELGVDAGSAGAAGAGGVAARADGLDEVRAWEEQRTRALGLTEATRTRAHVYDTRRVLDSDG